MNEMIRSVLLLAIVVCSHAALADPLRGRVPADALGYARIPDVAGFLTAPKDSVLKGALSHPDHVAQIEGLREAIYRNLLGGGDGRAGPLATLLIGHLTAPMEAVVVAQGPDGRGLPSVLFRSVLDFESIAAFRTALDELANQNEEAQVLMPVGDDGFGIVLAGSVPLMVQFDPVSGEIYLLASVGIDRQRFEQLMRLPAVAASSSMRAMENRIDTSGRGLFVWWNVAAAMPLMRGMTDPVWMGRLDRWGLADVRSAALGWGVEGGRGRLSVLLDSPNSGYRGLFPEVVNDLSLSAAGEPGLVVALPVLDQRIVDALLEIADREGRPGVQYRYRTLSERITRDAGVSPEAFLSAIGPESIFLSDRAGMFFAVRVADPRAYRKIVSKLAGHPGVEHETRRIGGLEYHHLTVAENRTVESAGSPRDRFRTHLFWVEEGDFLVFASTPQALMDRQRMSGVTLEHWLRENQGVEARSALFLFSTEVPNLPRIAYYTYLDLLMVAGDLAGYPVRIFDLPSAGQLALPETGAYSVIVRFSDPMLGLEFVFENNPAEVLVALGPGSLGVVGVVAAIAFPAYQDYLLRANAAAALQVGTGRLKTAVSEYHSVNGRLPKGMEELGLDPAGIRGDSWQALVDELGIVRISFTGGPLADGSVLFIPHVFEGQLEWLCRARDVSAQYLPAECR